MAKWSFFHTTFLVAISLELLLQTMVNCQQDYNLNEVLHDSWLFYEAQRSGKLPASNRIPWRGDSMLYDRGNNGEDLTGGYFDAGDHVKFNFPMAFSLAVLSWGMLDYAEGYKKAGEYENGLDALRWGLDYFKRAHPSPNVLYAQVGDGVIDHAYWGRPEDFNGPRPAHQNNETHPGSDLAGDAVAMFSAASLVFRESGDWSYADDCLRHAKELYYFADTFRGRYSDFIPADAYGSYSYGDELAWAAAWLYRATQDEFYLSRARAHFDEFALQYWSAFSWDSKHAGAQVLMAKLTGEQVYRDTVQSFCDYVAYEAPRTPKGLVFISEWGSLRNTANPVFICMQAADLGINSEANYALAREQINYMLGSSGRSYVIGFGFNPPTKPHHRASSCRSPPESCDNAFNHDGPNPHTLTGALVGGPDINDFYEDRREDWVKNEVALDYNAAFQSCVAGLNR